MKEVFILLPPLRLQLILIDIIDNNVLLETVRGYCFLQRSEYHPLIRILTACAMSTISTSPLLCLNYYDG